MFALKVFVRKDKGFVNGRGHVLLEECEFIDFDLEMLKDLGCDELIKEIRDKMQGGNKKEWFDIK